MIIEEREGSLERLIHVEELERRHIARDIHDDTIAAMTAASCLVSVSWMRSISPRPFSARRRVTSRVVARVVFGVAGSTHTDCCK